MSILARNACPTLADPMRTGDGWLARLPPLLVSLTPAQLAGIGRAALVHGNGRIEISKRGNFQIRGVAEHGGPALADDLAALGLPLPAGVPITADPLADRGGFSPGSIAEALHARLDQTGLSMRLAPKIAIVLDFGTSFRPASVSADLRLRYVAGSVDIGLGGDDAGANWIGTVPEDRADDAAIAILDRLADFGPSARMADVRDEATFWDAVGGMVVDGGLAAAKPQKPVMAALVAAIHDFRDAANQAANQPEQVVDARDEPGHDGRRGLAEVAFPFGQSHASDLIALAQSAERAGIRAIAPAPERRLLFAGTSETVALTRDAARDLGFIVDASDPRRAISACIGSAGCASGFWPSRAVADATAKVAPGLLDGSISVHLSGCAKGCAHPEPAALTLVGIDKGIGIVLHGRARDVSSGFGAADAVPARLSQLAAAVEREKRPGESVRDVLARSNEQWVERALSEPIRDGSTEHGGEPRIFA